MNFFLTPFFSSLLLAVFQKASPPVRRSLALALRSLAADAYASPDSWDDYLAAVLVAVADMVDPGPLSNE